MSQRCMQNLQKYVTGKFTSFYIRVWSESFDKIFLCWKDGDFAVASIIGKVKYEELDGHKFLFIEQAILLFCISRSINISLYLSNC